MIRPTSGLVLDSYARESDERRSKRRGRSMSLEGQHAVNESRIEEYGGTLGKRLEDKGTSAWDPKVKREHWEELLSRLESGESQGVVIFDIERFLRRIEDAVRIVKLAERGFKVIDSDGEYDLTTPQGQKNFYEAAVSAQYYSHRLSTRVRRGWDMKIREGEWFTGKNRMFGFEPNGTDVRQDEAELIPPAAAALLAGAEPVDVYQKWNTDGHLTTAGNLWETDGFRKLMVNPRLAGYIRRNGAIVGRLKGEPILDPTIWQQVVQWYAARSGRPPTRAQLCSGQKAVVCGNCGNTFKGSVDTGRKVIHYEDGQPTRRYYCSKGNGGCGRIIADQRVLDEHLEAIVLDVLSDPEHMDQIRRRAQQEAKAREPIEAEIVRLRGLEKYWGERLNAGKITLENHDAMTADITEKLAQQNEKLEALGTSMAAPDDELTNDARAKWEDAEGAERRAMLRKALAGLRVEVDPGSVRDRDLTNRIRVLPASGVKA